MPSILALGLSHGRGPSASEATDEIRDWIARLGCGIVLGGIGFPIMRWKMDA